MLSDFGCKLHTDAWSFTTADTADVYNFQACQLPDTPEVAIMNLGSLATYQRVLLPTDPSATRPELGERRAGRPDFPYVPWASSAAVWTAGTAL